MTSHWPRLEAAGPPVTTAPGRLELDFFRHGERSRLGRQFVSYPFHVTRPFQLDRAIPALSTVYVQSSSGGLYRAEDLSCSLAVGTEAAAHITTQAATVVHDCHGKPSRQSVTIRVEEGGFLAFTPDPLVLFPGALCHTAVEATLAPGGSLLLTDAFACHDPLAVRRPFDALRSDVVVRDTAGNLLVRDSFSIRGADLRRHGPLGAGWEVATNCFLLGQPARLPCSETLAEAVADAVVGVTRLPGGIGWGVRCLARHAVAARAVADRIFALHTEKRFGAAPVPRRK